MYLLITPSDLFFLIWVWLAWCIVFWGVLAIFRGFSKICFAIRDIWNLEGGILMDFIRKL